MHRKMKIILTIVFLFFFCFNYHVLAQTEKDKSQFKHERTGEPISIVKCVFDKTANFWIGKKKYTTKNNLIDTVIIFVKDIFSKSKTFPIGNQEGELYLTHDKDFSFIIAGLDTIEPKMKGNMGESDLHILWRTEDTIYLAELTPLKNAINYITLFTKRRVVIFSKQYEMSHGEIAAYMCVGHFE